MRGDSDIVNLQGSGWSAVAVDPIQVGGEAFNIWSNLADGDAAVIAIQEGVIVNEIP